MNRFIAMAAAILFFSFPAHADWSVAGMNRQIDQTNFVVNEGCSGTLVDLENRYILTANHCIKGQYEIVEREVVKDDGTVVTEKVRRLKPGVVRQLVFDGALEVSETTFRTKVIAIDAPRDLALLQVVSKIPNTMSARLSCVPLVRGDTVYVVGNPKGLYSSVVKGIVSSLQRSYELLRFGDADSQQKALMQVSAGIVGGNSGGAIYDGDGQLIGVAVIAYNTNEVLGFGVPLDDIKDFLKTNKLQSVFNYCKAPR